MGLFSKKNKSKARQPTSSDGTTSWSSTSSSTAQSTTRAAAAADDYGRVPRVPIKTQHEQIDSSSRPSLTNHSSRSSTVNSTDWGAPSPGWAQDRPAGLERGDHSDAQRLTTRTLSSNGDRTSPGATGPSWDPSRVPPLVYGSRQPHVQAQTDESKPPDAPLSTTTASNLANNDAVVEKRSLWRLPRMPGSNSSNASNAAKKRASSLGSPLGGSDPNEDSGFFVKSFRTVSRVQETISPGPYESMPAGAALPLPPRQPTRSQTTVSDWPAPSAHQQRKSFEVVSGGRASFDSSSSSRPLPQRPPLATTRLGSGSGRDDSDRAMSPTISVEAFRLASNRSKSTVSLASYADEATHPAHDRPRFEPDKSRRSSLKSESDTLLGQSALQPPRFQFGTQHSRSSSNQSFGSIHTSDEGRGNRSPGISPSQSASRLVSGTEPPLVVDTDVLHTSPINTSLPTSASTESELKLIGLYGNSPTTPSTDISMHPWSFRMSTSGTSHTSPAASTPSLVPQTSFEGSANQDKPSIAPRRDSSSSLQRPTFSSSSTHTRLNSAPPAAPSFSVQPPTPAPKGSLGSLTPSSRRSPHSRNVSAMAALSKSAKAKGKASAWGNDSSDEHSEQESSDEDDEVPLAQIKSRSQTDLSLPPSASRSSLYSHGTKARSNIDVARVRRTSSEVEVLLESPPPRAAVLPTLRSVNASVESLNSKRTSQMAPAGPAYPPKSALRPSRSQRRSVSALSISSQPPAPVSQPLAVRSNSGPSAAGPPVIDFTIPAISTSPLMASLSSPPTTATAGAAAPVMTHQPRAQSLSSSISGSGSGSGSSAPRTPKDMSPAVSDLGLKGSAGSGSTIASSVIIASPNDSPVTSTTALPGQLAYDDQQRRTVKFAADTPTALPSILKKSSRTSVQQTTGSGVRQSWNGTGNHNFVQQQEARFGTGARTASTAFQHGHSSSLSAMGKNTNRNTLTNQSQHGDVFDRMKARHKAEALQAIALGRDLNGPDDVAIKDDEGDDDEEDDEPLASLPARRGSQAGSAYGGFASSGSRASVIGSAGMGQMGNPYFAPQSSFGGFSPLAVAPPGVDPFLYASLPNDQKMQLHQRSQQMMQMMAQAAMQAKAESEAGWDGSSQMSGSTSNHRATRRHIPGSMSMGNLAAFSSMPNTHPMMSMMGYGAGAAAANLSMYGMHAPQAVPLSSYGQQQPMRGAKLPPFAPTFAMSQPMYQPSMYAGSSLGQPMTASSAMGVSPSSSPSASPRHSRNPAASALGVSPRRS
ncbi:hypothetical protein OIO90_000633 [Microbotryomycetes sp. JL221]|nr:hypothetical protein OIO90_000633 [Microbotryomycetes sp. JL221]